MRIRRIRAAARTGPCALTNLSEAERGLTRPPYLPSVTLKTESFGWTFSVTFSATSWPGFAS
jgi:hypothetical protein